MQAMANEALRVLTGAEEAKNYSGQTAWAPTTCPLAK